MFLHLFLHMFFMLWRWRFWDVAGSVGGRYNLYRLRSCSGKESQRFFLPILLLIAATQLASPSSNSPLLSTRLDRLEPAVGVLHQSAVITGTSLSHKLQSTARTQAIFNVLNAHYQATGPVPVHSELAHAEPLNIVQTLSALANYYQQYPEASKLILGLADHQWTLKYLPKTLKTQVTGSRLAIDHATIYFDPKSGAKLKFHNLCDSKKPFCIASPADALLHELLHLDVMLNDPQTFISQGGLSPYSYPAAHEQHIIALENKLYGRMSRRDQTPRPIRADHKGRHILVACVTCIE